MQGAGGGGSRKSGKTRRSCQRPSGEKIPPLGLGQLRPPGLLGRKEDARRCSVSPTPSSRRDSGSLLHLFIKFLTGGPSFSAVILPQLLPSLPLSPSLTHPLSPRSLSPVDPGKEGRGSGSSPSCWRHLSSWPPVETRVRAGFQLLPLGVPALRTTWGNQRSQVFGGKLCYSQNQRYCLLVASGNSGMAPGAPRTCDPSLHIDPRGGKLWSRGTGASWEKNMREPV